MAGSTRISQFAKQDLWTRDLTTMSWLQRLGTQALRLATAVGMEFRHRLLDARAAGSGLHDVAVVGAVSRRDVLGAEGLRCPPCDRTLLGPNAGAARPQESGDHHDHHRLRGQYQDGRAGGVRDCRPVLYDLFADRQDRAGLECDLAGQAGTHLGTKVYRLFERGPRGTGARRERVRPARVTPKPYGGSASRGNGAVWDAAGVERRCGALRDALCRASPSSTRRSPIPMSRCAQQRLVASRRPFSGSSPRKSLRNSWQPPPVTARSIRVLPCSCCSCYGSTPDG